MPGSASMAAVRCRTGRDGPQQVARMSEAKSGTSGLDLCSAAVGSVGPALATVAQPCGDPVDGQMDRLHHALVGLAGPMTLQQFDLYMVERIEVGEAVLDRARQQGILVEQCLLASDGEQHINRAVPFGTQPRKDGFAQFGVLDELRVA